MACIAVYCSRELFPIPVTYVYIIYDYTYTMLCIYNINFIQCHVFYLVYWPIRPWFVWQRRGIPVQQPCPDAPLEGETKTKIKRVILLLLLQYTNYTSRVKSQGKITIMILCLYYLSNWLKKLKPKPSLKSGPPYTQIEIFVQGGEPGSRLTKAYSKLYVMLFMQHSCMHAQQHYLFSSQIDSHVYKHYHFDRGSAYTMFWLSYGYLSHSVPAYLEEPLASTKAATHTQRSTHSESIVFTLFRQHS